MASVPLPIMAAGERPATFTVTGADAGALVRRSILPGGVRVLTERMPGLRSVSIGCWVGVGSRDETTGHHGSTHFLEHLLFKGTSRRTALDIATAFDAVGGEANAATGKEHTCYYARVLDDDLPMAVDVITDMVTSALVDPDDFDSERGVILEELAMNDDDPADVVHERFAEVVLGAHPLGRPIGGTPETIRAVGRDDVMEHYRAYYTSPQLVFTAAGGVDHDELVALVESQLARARRAGWRWPAAAVPVARRPGAADAAGAPHGTVVVVPRPIEQANIMLGSTGLTAGDPRRHALSVLNAVLGGGMSSRLFQEIREKRGLAYSVYSFSSQYSDSGYFGMYAGCTPGKVDQVLELLRDGLRAMAATPLGEDELSHGVGQLTGGLVLGLEDSGSRMTRLGKAELVHGEYVDLDESVRRLQAVTTAQVQALAAELLGRPRSLAVVGPFDADHDFTGVVA